VRGGAGGLQVNDADAGGRHGRNMVAQPANPKGDGLAGGFASPSVSLSDSSKLRR
jgi:hypothetical protein